MLVKALASKGITGHDAGVRINNEKYYTVQFDEEALSWYLKKVRIINLYIYRIKEVLVLQ